MMRKQKQMTQKSWLRKMFRFGVTGLMILSAFTLLSSPVAAVTLAPRGYNGYVYIDGELAPEGLQVKACIDGVFYDDDAGIIDSTGIYSLNVMGDDDATTAIKEGSVAGDDVIFWVGDNIANESANFVSGGSETLDLHVMTSVQPAAFLKINEIMSYPSSGAEWIELYNPTLQSTQINRD